MVIKKKKQQTTFIFNFCRFLMHKELCLARIVTQKKAVQIIECMMTNFISLKDDWIDGAIFSLPENRSPKKKRNFLLKYRKKYSNLKAVKKKNFWFTK